MNTKDLGAHVGLLNLATDKINTKNSSSIMIKKYRRKPVVVEAIRFTGENWQEIQEWMANEKSKQFKTISCDKNGTVLEIILKTPEGEMTVSIGDYVIKEIGGEFYPYKFDIFEATYEEIK